MTDYTNLMNYTFDGHGAALSTTFGYLFTSTLSSFHVVEVVDVLRNIQVKVDTLHTSVPQQPYLAELLST